MIRLLAEKDVPRLRSIHQQFYEEQFIFPEFDDPKWVGKYVVTDDFDNIVLFGGTKLILETVAVTDKRYSVRERRSALLQFLQAAIFVSAGLNFDQLHAFIQEESWAKHLKKYKFKPCKGEALVLNLE